MEFWKKAQKPAAVTSGIILLLLIVAVLVRDYLPPIQIIVGQQQAKESESKPVAEGQQPGSTDAKSEAKGSESPASERSTGDSYAYVAQFGSSYTELVRDAIAQYAQVKQLELTPSQLLAAEVQLANAAGSPELEVGDTVELAASDVAKVLPAETKTADAPTPAKEAKPQASTDYHYTVAAGDSYTTLARDAVAQYIERENRTLTVEQRVYAESQLAVTAGSPLIVAGQDLTIGKDAVKAAVDAASQVSAAQQASWHEYAVLAAL